MVKPGILASESRESCSQLPIYSQRKFYPIQAKPVVNLVWIN